MATAPLSKFEMIVSGDPAYLQSVVDAMNAIPPCYKVETDYDGGYWLGVAMNAHDHAEFVNLLRTYVPHLENPPT